MGNPAIDGSDQGGPGKWIGPLADGMRVGHTVGDLEVQATSGQPRLAVA